MDQEERGNILNGWTRRPWFHNTPLPRPFWNFDDQEVKLIQFKKKEVKLIRNKKSHHHTTIHP